MSDGAPPNIYDDHWEREFDRGNWGVKGRRVAAAAGARDVGVALYELAPGKKNFPYHAHHVTEEVLVVLSGRPTLRTPEGEREVGEGEVIAFPPGLEGAHQLINRSAEPARVLMISNNPIADIVEYPDSKKISASAGVWGTPEAVSWRLSTESRMEYFEGEPD